MSDKKNAALEIGESTVTVARPPDPWRRHLKRAADELHKARTAPGAPPPPGLRSAVLDLELRLLDVRESCVDR